MTDYNFYLAELAPQGAPSFLNKYLQCPSLLRLKGIGYFCGMDHASSSIYHFPEYISRFDHSLSTALLAARFTSAPATILAALFHDIATPCFSHAIDFMNQDYEKQESTEEYTERLLCSDKHLMQCLASDHLTLADVADFKHHPLVDNDRPRLCADRLDGLILSGIGWTQDLNRATIHDFISDATIYENEDGLPEIGFKTRAIAERALVAAESLDNACSDREDVYMMGLLADITRRAIDLRYISYNDLYKQSEKELLDFLYTQPDPELTAMLTKFTSVAQDDIPPGPLPKIKSRKLNPLVNGERLIKA